MSSISEAGVGGSGGVMPSGPLAETAARSLPEATPAGLAPAIDHPQQSGFLNRTLESIGGLRQPLIVDPAGAFTPASAPTMEPEPAGTYGLTPQASHTPAAHSPSKAPPKTPTNDNRPGSFAYYLREKFDALSHGKNVITMADIDAALQNPNLDYGSRNALLLLKKRLAKFAKDPQKGFTKADLEALEKACKQDPNWAAKWDEKMQNMPESTRTDAIRHGLDSGETVRFKSSHGKSEDVTVRKTGSAAGYDVYQVQVGSNSFQFKVRPGHDAASVLQKVLNAYLEIPPHLRGSIKSVEIHDETRPKGKDTVVAGDEDAGVIRLFDGEKWLSDDKVFLHEAGHAIGEMERARKENTVGHVIAKFRDRDAIPVEWPDAVAADGGSVSKYGDTNLNEDFAESWQQFTQDPRGFEQRHPNRAKILKLAGNTYQ